MGSRHGRNYIVGQIGNSKPFLERRIHPPPRTHNLLRKLAGLGENYRDLQNSNEFSSITSLFCSPLRSAAPTKRPFHIKGRPTCKSRPLIPTTVAACLLSQKRRPEAQMPPHEPFLRLQRRALTAGVFRGYATKPWHWHTLLVLELPPLLRIGRALSVIRAAGLTKKMTSSCKNVSSSS